MCPRCKKEHTKSVRIKHSKVYVEVTVCCVCGFMFLEEEEEIKLAGVMSKKMFLKSILNIGKTSGR